MWIPNPNSNLKIGKINLKCIIAFSIICKTKTLDDSIGGNLCYVELGEESLDHIKKVWSLKEKKNDKLNYIRI